MKVLITSNFNSAMQSLSKAAQREVSSLYTLVSSLSREELVNSPLLTKLEFTSGDIYTLRTRTVRVFCAFDSEDDLLFLDVKEVKGPTVESAPQPEITLFTPRGAPQAYIATDEENTIYSFDGRPLGYIDDQANVYGFNGRHLGWFEEGKIWDHEGRRVGYTSQTCPAFVQFEPFKGFKRFKPFKAFAQFPPFKPFKSLTNSQIDLLRFLEQGAK